MFLWSRWLLLLAFEPAVHVGVQYRNWRMPRAALVSALDGHEFDLVGGHGRAQSVDGC